MNGDERNSVDGAKLMDVVFTVSGGVYGMFKEKVGDLYTNGVLQGSLPKGVIVTGVVFDVANEAVKLSFAIASGDPREVAKVTVVAVGGATGVYLGGALGAGIKVNARLKPITILGGMAAGSLIGDGISEWVFNTYIWPQGAAAPGSVSAGGLSLSVNVSSAPIDFASVVVDIPLPADANVRDPSDYLFVDANQAAHSVTLLPGGTVWDAYVQQRHTEGGINDWLAFQQAVAVSNPGIPDLSQIVAGTTLYLPEQHGDGSITYHYGGGAAITTNAVDGTYHMVLPNAEGGRPWRNCCAVVAA